jgi:hypothetical protein
MVRHALLTPKVESFITVFETLMVRNALLTTKLGSLITGVQDTDGKTAMTFHSLCPGGWVSWLDFIVSE